MAELEIQRFLRNGGTLGDLKREPYNLNIRATPDGRVGFKYNQIKSDMSLRICQEARGVVLDMNNNWDVVSLPFFKFFNSGEKYAADLDYANAEVVEKLDGTCICVYNWMGQWKAQTLGTVEGEGEVYNDGVLSLDFEGETFSDLFFHAWDKVYPHVPIESLNPQLNYIFELMTPFNRIVTRYEGYRLVLTGVRNRNTFEEYDPREFKDTFEVPRYFSFRNLNLDQVMASLDFLRDDEEGYVIVDKDFQRVKVKSPTYVMYHRQKDHATNRKHGTLKLILLGKEDDFVASFPEFGPEIDEVKLKIRSFLSILDDLYAQCDGENCVADDRESRKEFALRVKHLVPPSAQGFMFARMAGKVDSFEQSLVELAEADNTSNVVRAMNELDVLEAAE